MIKRAEIGVFGGSGFYQLADDVEEIWVETPYGAPSDKIALTTIGGKQVAFLPRHGKEHIYPPHMINYRANVWAMKHLGVERLIGPCAAGSLQPGVEPGDFVISDQFVNFTHGRRDTFYDGPTTTHISSAEPYCGQLRQHALTCAEQMGLSVHSQGTVVVIQGPRFSSRAESRFFAAQGWEVINMTQYPEAILARELEMCYVNIALITDYDAGLAGNPDILPVSHEEVIRVFSENNDRLRNLIFKMIEKIPSDRACGCKDALGTARM
ncbi:MAG: S-methyl-5'-thioadenosine phosphorylase [Limnochordia bacterium]|nr:S-methyl-5'-thioadenosine phosphorylase [Limnochordia bacterium]